MTLRVLIAEDEEALAVLLRYNLEAEGFAVEHVVRGDEADLRLKEDPPDLLLLDWMMPGLSGIEICRRLRSRKETARLPVIMLTARGEETDRVRGLETGADDYIVKPFSVPELMARVNALRSAGTRRSAGGSPREARASRGEGAASRAHGIPPAGIPDAKSGAGLFAQPASRWRLGP
jgi:DNA-binding response OmpR family regulator